MSDTNQKAIVNMTKIIADLKTKLTFDMNDEIDRHMNKLSRPGKFEAEKRIVQLACVRSL